MNAGRRFAPRQCEMDWSSIAGGWPVNNRAQATACMGAPVVGFTPRSFLLVRRVELPAQVRHDEFPSALGTEGGELKSPEFDLLAKHRALDTWAVCRAASIISSDQLANSVRA